MADSVVGEGGTSILRTVYITFIDIKLISSLLVLYKYYYLGAPLLLSAVTQTTAHLPCNIAPPVSDTTILILWYKEGTNMPIYR